MVFRSRERERGGDVGQNKGGWAVCGNDSTERKRKGRNGQVSAVIVSKKGRMWALVVLLALLETPAPAIGLAVCPAHTTNLRRLARKVFRFGYLSYIEHAFPLDELDPIHCTGRGVDPDPTNINVNDVLGNYSLTLVDSLDAVAIMVCPANRSR
jgi:hypothetical protein